MLDWLNTPPNTHPAENPRTGELSGEARESTIFPVSRFHETPENQNREAANPHGYGGFPVSRFSRFQNRGGPEKTHETAPKSEGKAAGIPYTLPALLRAVAAILEPVDVEELRAMSNGNPEQAAAVCRLILAAPAFPSDEDAAELDRLILRLCDLEPCLAGYLPAMQQARSNMAPARYPEELAKFRQWVREAEAKQAGALPGAGDGRPFAL
jgi:hypothetical protein